MCKCSDDEDEDDEEDDEDRLRVPEADDSEESVVTEKDPSKLPPVPPPPPPPPPPVKYPARNMTTATTNRLTLVQGVAALERLFEYGCLPIRPTPDDLPRGPCELGSIDVCVYVYVSGCITNVQRMSCM